MSKRKTGYFLVIPVMVILVVLSIYPFAYSLRLSFFRWDLARTPTIGPFVGLSNYVRMIQSEHFQNSLGITAIFVLSTVSLELLLGLFIAMHLYKDGKLHRVVKKMLILPFVISPALIGFSWRFFLNPDFGIIDHLIKSILPIDKKLIFFGDPTWALPTLIFVDVWQWTPLVVLIFSAGLASLPRELYDAAQIDGAGRFKLFRFLTMPLLVPTVLVALIIKTLHSVKELDKVLLLTRGGPGRATEVISYHLYKVGFMFFRMGDAAAISYLLVMIMIILVTLYIKMFGRSIL